MKKSLFFAALAVTALCGCSSDTIDVTVDNGQASDELVPIQLGVGRGIASVVQTRGTGTVGSSDVSDNAWHYEALRVLMMQIPDENHTGYNFTIFEKEDPSAPLQYLFNGSFICKPTAETPTNLGAAALDYATYTNGAMRYYPMSGSSEFFAYHIDDAALDANGALIDVTQLDANGNPDAPSYTKDETAKTVTVPFIIDGSQDLMAGKATNYPAGSRGFSAASARANYVPNIVMNHLLTRLDFAVRPGTAKAATVKVNALRVKSVQRGTLLAAYDEYTDTQKEKAPKDLIEWSTDAADEVFFGLKSRKNTWYSDSEKKKESLETVSTLFDFGSIADINSAVGNQTSYPIGNGAALFVQPNVNIYDLELDVEHTILVDGATPQSVNSTLQLKIKLDAAASQPFLDGNSYHIDIVVYGYNEIEVEATLVPWVEAESRIIDTADPENPKAPSDLTITSGATMDLDLNGTLNGTITSTTSSLGAITYESSDPAVATVDEYGNVTAVAVGTATITVSQAADTSYSAGSKTVTVTVVDTTPAP